MQRYRAYTINNKGIDYNKNFYRKNKELTIMLVSFIFIYFTNLHGNVSVYHDGSFSLLYNTHAK